MLKLVVLTVIVLLAAVLLIAARRPDSFRVQRKLRIKAAPEKIFPFINDLRIWGAWSPYEKLDPAMRRTFSGAAGGRGAVYEWQGNHRAGTGRLEIIDATEPSRVILELDMLSPCQGSNLVEFTLQPEDDATEVNWEMDGPMSFFGKLVSVFVDMDKLIGRQFESGLANLRALAEQSAARVVSHSVASAAHQIETSAHGEPA
jgi:hypothetical protein